MWVLRVVGGDWAHALFTHLRSGIAGGNLESMDFARPMRQHCSLSYEHILEPHTAWMAALLADGVVDRAGDA
jgi:hypothetical protein